MTLITSKVVPTSVVRPAASRRSDSRPDPGNLGTDPPLEGAESRAPGFPTRRPFIGLPTWLLPSLQTRAILTWGWALLDRERFSTPTGTRQ